MRGIAVFAAGFLLVAAGSATEIKRVTGRDRLGIENSAVSDLSGIVWMGGDSFAAVSDKRNVIQFVTLQIDHATGEIVSGHFDETREVQVPGRTRDFEGIAWVAAAKTFYISAEQGDPLIRLAAGQSAARAIAIPEIFSKTRPNLGLEALSWSEATRQFWVANEEALRPDGPVSSHEAGTFVRVQKFDERFRPIAQYAWRTEPAGFRYGNAGSGVSDLCALPDGKLIVLERGFAQAGLQLRLFLADFRTATDISKNPALQSARVNAGKKILLFEEGTGFINFEGLTLGPPLAGGWRSIIVVADSNGTSSHAFLALKVRLASSEE